MGIQILNSRFHHDQNNEFIQVDYLTNCEKHSKLLKIEEVLDFCFQIPQVQLSDSKLLRKAEELVSKGLVEI